MSEEFHGCPPYASLQEFADAYGLDLPRASRIRRGKLPPPRWVCDLLVDLDGLDRTDVHQAVAEAHRMWVTPGTDYATVGGLPTGLLVAGLFGPGGDGELS